MYIYIYIYIYIYKWHACPGSYTSCFESSLRRHLRGILKIFERHLRGIYLIEETHERLISFRGHLRGIWEAYLNESEETSDIIAARVATYKFPEIKIFFKDKLFSASIRTKLSRIKKMFINSHLNNTKIPPITTREMSTKVNIRSECMGIKCPDLKKVSENCFILNYHGDKND